MKNVSIVVVEDELELKNLIVDMMDLFLDVKADSFDNGLSAWQHIKENKITIIISDIDMPGMNGLELLRSVKAQFPETIFLCMSGRAMEHKEKAKELGAEYFIPKPFEINDFVEVVKKYIPEEEK